jgi:hypothetical protein
MITSEVNRLPSFWRTRISSLLAVLRSISLPTPKACIPGANKPPTTSNHGDGHDDGGHTRGPPVSPEEASANAFSLPVSWHTGALTTTNITTDRHTISRSRLHSHPPSDPIFHNGNLANGNNLHRRHASDNIYGLEKKMAPGRNSNDNSGGAPAGSTLRSSSISTSSIEDQTAGEGIEWKRIPLNRALPSLGATRQRGSINAGTYTTAMLNGSLHVVMVDGHLVHCMWLPRTQLWTVLQPPSGNLVTLVAIDGDESRPTLGPLNEGSVPTSRKLIKTGYLLGMTTSSSYERVCRSFH